MTEVPIIHSVSSWAFCPGFRDGPYQMSHVVQESLFGRMIAVETNQGITGIGELVFPPLVAEQALKEWCSMEQVICSELIGKELGSIISVAQDLAKQTKQFRGVSFGLETAVLDIRSRLQQISLANLLGGEKSTAVNDYFSISETDPERIRQRLELAGSNRAVIQLKLGVGAQDDDVNQVKQVLKMLRSDQVLLADANGAWQTSEACQIIKIFGDESIIWEEPCKTYEENKQIAEHTGKPVMFDQCVGNLETAMRAIDDDITAAICIKPAFLGGLNNAKEVRDRCAEKRIKMRIDGPWCGDIATAAILHLAVGAPPELLVAGCDLREPLTIDADLSGVRVIESGRIAPPTGFGLGIDFDVNLFAEPDVTYS